MNRRELLVGGLSTSVLGACLSTPPGPSTSTSDLPARLVDFSALQLSDAIRSGQVSCSETMQAYLAQIETYNPTYNALISMLPSEQCLQFATRADQALAQGDYWGWMHGMPFAVKEFVDVEGFVTGYGSPLLAENVAQKDALLAKRVKAQGAIIFGKTNVPEWGFGSQSYNTLHGTVANAYDPALTAGGSSGGTASALRTKMLPVADGSDMMGSLRNPAAFNNVIGFRPTQGRVPSGDQTDLFYNQLSTLGPMGRNTRDTIQLLLTIAGPDKSSPLSLRDPMGTAADFAPTNLEGVKIGWMGDYDGYLATEDGLLSLCEANFSALTDAGAKIEQAQPEFDMARLWETWLTLRQYSAYSGLKDLYANEAARAFIKPEAIWEIEGGMSLQVSDLVSAQTYRSDWFRALAKLFERYDFLMLPTAQVFPFSKEVHWPQSIGTRQMDTYHRWMEVTIGATLAGIPAVSIPAGFDQTGRPMGMQVLAPFGKDKAALEFALAYEAITDHLDRKPELLSA